MKCPRCWAEKAFIRKVTGWQGFFLDCLLLIPMKCHHCYHKFVVFWPFAVGQDLQQPPVRNAPPPRTANGPQAARQRAVNASADDRQ